MLSSVVHETLWALPAFVFLSLRWIFDCICAWPLTRLQIKVEIVLGTRLWRSFRNRFSFAFNWTRNSLGLARLVLWYASELCLLREALVVVRSGWILELFFSLLTRGHNRGSDPSARVGSWLFMHLLRGCSLDILVTVRERIPRWGAVRWSFNPRIPFVSISV